MTSANSPNNPPHFGNIPFTGVNIPLKYFDISDIQNDCGFQAKISFAEGTKRTMDWLKEN